MIEVILSMSTVSRRSEPSSRTLLTGEQPDAWKLLHLRARMSRHRNVSLLKQNV